jgi:hypothetical protein
MLGLGTTLALMVASGATALAKTSEPANPQAPASTPSGYLIVISAIMTASNGVQTFGTVACPATSGGVTRSPQSGGVLVTSSSLGANIDATYPDVDRVSWDVYVHNNSGTDTSFRVYAVCAKPRTGYAQISSASFTDPAGGQASGVALCPSGTKILGGGAVIVTGSLLANINSSFPSGTNAWRVDANNGSPTSTTFNVYAVCSNYGARKNYGVHIGAAVDNPPGTETAAPISCPAGQSSLGGGVVSSSFSTAVNINSTFPLTGGWANDVNNGTTSDASIIPYVICAT